MFFTQAQNNPSTPEKKFSFKLKKYWPWLALTMLLIVSLFLRGLYTHVKSLDFDEGHWLMFGMLARQGHKPYSEIFVGIPPLALWTIELGVAWFGTGRALRYPMILYSVVGVGAMYWLVRQQNSEAKNLAGLVAATFLSFGPRYFKDSSQIMTEVHSTALAILSLALANQYRLKRNLFWLFFSGLVFTLSISLKIFAIFIPVLVFLEILIAAVEQHRSEIKNPEVWLSHLQQLIRDGLVWVFGALLPLVLYIILYDPGAMYQQVVQFRVAIREVYVSMGESNIDSLKFLGQEYVQYIPWLVAAILGIIIQGKRGLRENWLWIAWFLLANVLLISHIPFRPRYSVLLFPPLAALSGTTSAFLLYRLRQTKKLSCVVATVLSGLLFAVLLIVVLIDPVKSAFSAPQSDLHGRHTARAEGVNFVREYTNPNDCVITDDQRFSLLANRLAPPWLTEISEARLATGWVTFDDIVTAINQNDCAATVYVSGRVDAYIPDLRNKLRELYFLEMKFKDIDVYAIKRNINNPPPWPKEHQLGTEIMLRGYALTPRQWRKGVPLALSTYWTAAAPITENYKIFIHFRTPDGQTVLQFDHYPFDGKIPTTTWLAGNMVKETFTIPWPDELAPGAYQIYIGMYNENTLERLQVQNDQSGENAILLDSIVVTD